MFNQFMVLSLDNVSLRSEDPVWCVILQEGLQLDNQVLEVLRIESLDKIGELKQRDNILN